jgi:hypothetical protein
MNEQVFKNFPPQQPHLKFCLIGKVIFMLLDFSLKSILVFQKDTQIYILVNTYLSTIISSFIYKYHGPNNKEKVN